MAIGHRLQQEITPFFRGCPWFQLLVSFPSFLNEEKVEEIPTFYWALFKKQNGQLGTYVQLCDTGLWKLGYVVDHCIKSCNDNHSSRISSSEA
jgi:hypothetical protein